MNMKRLHLCLLTIMMIALPVLQSCSDDDGYSLGHFVERLATVKVISGNTYYLEIDNGKTLWPAATNVGWYKPIDGQRVIANYTLLYDNFSGYDHAIRVNFLQNILTKRIEDLTEDNEEEIGNDPVNITKNGIWIGGKYLNIDFLINLPQSQKHRVSLVRNTLVEESEDGYLHLEYRYNDFGDVTGYWRRSIVSFNIGELLTEESMATYKGIKFKFNFADVGEKVLVYEFFNNEETPDKSIDNSSEVMDDPTGKID